MAVLFTIPGKTFLLGEYLALHGGPTLVALTQPCFQFKAQVGHGKTEGIHSDSPAGKFIQLKSDFFKNYDVNFEDPYTGTGGFGASTAQFLAAYALWLHADIHQHEMEKLFDYKHLLETYKQVAWNGKGFAPSGADLIGQLKGSLTFFEKRRSSISIASWPFADLEFYLIHTGYKIATHEHLNSLPSFKIDKLEHIFSLVKEAFDSKQSQLFIDAVDYYAEELKALNLTCENTIQIVTDLKSVDGVKAAKGCGALGADVVLALVSSGHSAALKAYCQKNNLNIIASNEDVSAGLRISMKENK